MIHDIILTCLSLSRKGISIKSFLASDVVDQFIHQCERAIFVDILSILNHFNEVVRFAKYFKGFNLDIIDYDEAQEYSSGNYLKNFANGIEDALEDFDNDIVRLEALFEKNTSNSLIYVYNALELKLPVLRLLRKLINDAKIQKLHGCVLLQNINQHCEQGDIDQIIAKVAKPVKMAFFKHMVQWLLYGMIDDEHAEFFISYKSHKTGDNSSCEKSSTNSLTSVSEDEIWQYEINMNQLPSFVSTILAEKILFVGQTVLVFKMDRSKHKPDTWGIKMTGSSCDDMSELWVGNEAMFCKMIEDLSQDDKIDVYRLEGVINEIKKFVSERLSAIAVIEDDLNRQIHLIKDFYLLGRGEFYLEFLRQLYGSFEDNSEANAKNYIRIFEIAANTLGIADDLEHFSLSVQKTTVDLNDSCEYAVLLNLHLKYIYKWPLNLLFSPTTIERYNIVFRFLLIVRKLQYDLQLVWARHKWSVKKATPVTVKIMNFRNHLMFFMDNLQYYIQVDVLESQFSVLINVIKRKADFEEIQRAHSVFLANVLSQCFLLNDAADKKLNISQAKGSSQYPIYGTLLEIFSFCEKFCLLDLLEESSPDNSLKEIENLEEKFNVSIAALMKLLVNIKSASSFGSLSQLLLRLDYNRWYSSKTTKGNNPIVGIYSNQ